MARSSHQKQKILYIMQDLLEKSDEDHPMTACELLRLLEARGIPAERKSIYADIEALRDFGMDTLKGSGPAHGYYVGSRLFELPELKLLVDSVQSSKFLTEKKSRELIEKLETLCSAADAKTLARQVTVRNRVKTMNESIYYNVDAIHAGISQNREIRFRYFEYTVAKERRFRRENGWYQLTPLALVWDDENYYLIGYEQAAKKIKHFRVDKMVDICLTEEPRVQNALCQQLDPADYAKKVFGMFSGEEVCVKLRFRNHLVGAVLDRLGREVCLAPDGEEHFLVQIPVVISPQFFAWLCGFGANAELLGPVEVVEQFMAHLASMEQLYRKTK